MARQNFIGLVVSQGKMNKTVKVRVQTKAYDQKIHKEVLKRKDYLVHDEGNMCKEGDIVRIEAIPKISSRKYFAIAEIKVNKGQQFAAYETMAKEKVQREQQEKIAEFVARRGEFEKTISKVEDLKVLDRLGKAAQSSSDEDKAQLVAEINQIKEKYGIRAWPSTEPVLQLEVSEAAKDLSKLENRTANIKLILAKLMSPEHEQERQALLAQAAKGKGVSSTPSTQKNILRKFLLDPRNECPNVL